MKFLHTADWQLGLKLRYLAPERAAQLRLLRFQSVARIAALAKQRNVDFVLVAGDVLDDNALGRDALQQTSDALSHFGSIPVFLLPGNHDAASEDSALLRLELPPNVRVLHQRAPVDVPCGQVFPCPLMRRHEMDDPTSWMPARADGEGIRVAMAHGGVIDFDEGSSGETPNLIDPAKILAKGFDFLALGDWHGLFRYGPRVWYPGAHEATRFKEAKPGHVLIVDIESAGATPEVEAVHVAQTQWESLVLEFSDDLQVEELRQRLEAYPVRSQTLVELTITGSLSMAARDALDRLLEDYAERLAHLRSNLEGLHAEPGPEDLAQMGAEGFIAQALEQLRSGDAPADVDAVRLMYRLKREAENAVA